MPVIYTEKVGSTNAALKAMFLEQPIEDATWLIAHSQYAGKGQRGNAWQSEAGKNITLSLYKEFENLAVNAQFIISMQVALSIAKVLAIYIDQVSVKWPNDIMVANKKIGGVLIETAVKGRAIGWAVIGIGINIEQINFDSLPNATSAVLEGVTGISAQDFAEKLMPVLLQDLEDLKNLTYPMVQLAYERQLYGFQVNRKFKTPEGLEFTGVIQGVNKQGALVVKDKSGLLKTYDLKEIRMLF